MHIEKNKCLVSIKNARRPKHACLRGRHLCVIGAWCLLIELGRPGGLRMHAQVSSSGGAIVVCYVSRKAE
eukprot:scaffold238439_cov17-Tisochrysis_lutea.AAC.1